MEDTRWDAVIVGAGLAGITLAWQLQLAGQRVLVLDAGEPVTASKIAAGLITPITGQRLALSWRGEEFLLVARAFYAEIEARTGVKFFHERTALRLFEHEEERTRWAVRSLQPAFQAHLSHPQPVPLLDPKVAETAGGGFAMQAAQLDVATYLKASAACLSVVTQRLDWARDVQFHAEEMSAGRHRARYVLSCEGYAATQNPYFNWVRFKPAKGEILTVRFERPLPPVSLHRGLWLAPTAEPDVFRLGSTYDWATLDQVPTETARQELCARLRAWLHVPFTVLEHQAAVRPIIQESKALLGLHPARPRLGFFNGLGSKGSLHAPWFAAALTAHLCAGTPLPAEVDLQKNS